MDPFDLVETYIHELALWSTFQWVLFWAGVVLMAYGLRSHPKWAQWGAMLFLAAFFWPLLRQVHYYILETTGDPVAASLATIVAIFVGPKLLLELIKAALTRKP